MSQKENGMSVRRRALISLEMYSTHKNVVSNRRNKEKNKSLTSYTIVLLGPPSQYNRLSRGMSGHVSQTAGSCRCGKVFYA